VTRNACELYEYDGPTCGRGCSPNLIDIACSQPELSTFLSLIQLSGLDYIFECGGPFTLFLPHNDAFSDMRGHVLLDLLLPINADNLKDFILYHILPGSFLLQELNAGGKSTLIADANVTISMDPIMVNNVKVVAGDFLACNGVLHIINNVLANGMPAPPPPPPPLTDTPSYSYPTFEPSTVIGTFPPTNLPSTQLFTVEPSETPSRHPTISPMTITPSKMISGSPSISPSNTPITVAPSETPTVTPSVHPTITPSVPPTITPSAIPTIAPSVPPTSITPSAPPSMSTIQINVNRRFYFAFSSGSTIEPTADEYEQLRLITIMYYNDYIRRTFAVTRPLTEFIEWNTTLSNTMFNAGIPNMRFNIYAEYSMTTTIYTANSQNIPTPIEFLTTLKEGFLIEYLLNVTMLIGTPFEFVVEGMFSTI
jgi:uncharacterized surface protein with fasciclin (FAS1) repeats